MRCEPSGAGRPCRVRGRSSGAAAARGGAGHGGIGMESLAGRLSGSFCFSSPAAPPRPRRPHRNPLARRRRPAPQVDAHPREGGARPPRFSAHTRRRFSPVFGSARPQPSPPPEPPPPRPQCPAIQAELAAYRAPEAEEALRQKGQRIWSAAAREEAIAYGPQWRTLVLQDRSRWSDTNAALFPKTAQIVRDSGCPSVEVFFARQAPGSGIKPHSDGCNFILTSHLGLDVPEGRCWLKARPPRRADPAPGRPRGVPLGCCALQRRPRALPQAAALLLTPKLTPRAHGRRRSATRGARGRTARAWSSTRRSSTRRSTRLTSTDSCCSSAFGTRSSRWRAGGGPRRGASAGGTAARACPPRAHPPREEPCACCATVNVSAEVRARSRLTAAARAPRPAGGARGAAVRVRLRRRLEPRRGEGGGEAGGEAPGCGGGGGGQEEGVREGPVRGRGGWSLCGGRGWRAAAESVGLVGSGWPGDPAW